MKKSSLFIAMLIFTISLALSSRMFSQNQLNRAKIETIIKLTSFTDWSQNRNFADSKRFLYIISEKHQNINDESINTSNLYPKDWEIIYTDNLSKIENGSVIYILSRQKEIVQKAIDLSKTQDILTISDNLEYFCSTGGMINLIDQGSEIQFEINYRIIQNKNLEISSKVLALAKIYD